LLIQVLPARLFARWSTSVQGLLMAAFLLGGLYSWMIHNWTDRSPGASILTAIDRRAPLAAVISVLSAAAIYLAAYARHRKLLLEAQDMAAPSAWWKWSFLGLLAREPRRLAILHFLATVLSRSREIGRAHV